MSFIQNKYLKLFILFFILVLGLAGWRYFLHRDISKSEAEQIAAMHLIGKPHFSPQVPVEVRDTGQAYKVLFTFKVPEGMDISKGTTYNSYAVVHKKTGEVLELGVQPPGAR